MFYIFHGDDAYSQQHTLASLQARLGNAELLSLNTTRLEGKGLTLNQLRQACDVAPFLAARRLVVATNALTEATKGLLAELSAYLPHLPESTALVFLEDRPLAEKHPLLVLARANPAQGYEKRFDRPTGPALERWIVQQAAQRGGTMAPRAAAWLAANVGNDLQVLALEIEKLTLYQGAETIQPADVQLLSPYVAEANIFDLVDALGQRQANRAAALLQHKLVEGADPFYLFAMVVRQFRLLLQVRDALDAGLRPAAIAKELKLHPFVADKLTRQAQGFSLTQLENIYQHLVSLDAAVKTGQQDMTNALFLLVAGL